MINEEQSVGQHLALLGHHHKIVDARWQLAGVEAKRRCACCVEVDVVVVSQFATA